MPATATRKHLVELTTADKALVVDREKGVILGVKCLGESSLNGREYSRQAREQAAKLYDGMDVNLDHANEAGGDRSMMEGFGVLKNTRIGDDGSVYADLHYLTSHPSAPCIAERAEKMPLNFGLSHDAVGVMVEGTDGGNDIVESLEEVNSVDLVRKPATNAGLFESHRSPSMTAKPKKTTVRKVLEANKTHKHAKGFKKLIEEQDEFAAMAEAPVEVAPEATPEDQMKSAFRSMVMAAFDDDSLDMAATMAKIKEILKSQDKLAGGPAEEAPASEESGSSHEEELAPALEAIGKLNRRLDKMESGNRIEGILESVGLKPSDLDETQRGLLSRQKNEDDIKAVVEGFGVQPQRSNGTAKPRMPAKFQEKQDGGGNEDYETLLEKTRRPARKPRHERKQA